MSGRELTALKLAYGLKPSLLGRVLSARKETALVTYCVAPLSAEKRKDQRRRTRLRSGKILDHRNRFLIDVTILDRSSSGLRLRLARDSETPERFRLFDDESGLIFAARLVWRRQALVGARLDAGGPVPASLREIAALRGKFYAIRD